MIRLIKNELSKIFSRKSVYVILLLIVAIIFITTSFEKNEKEAQKYNRYLMIINNDRIGMGYQNMETAEGIKEYISLQTEIDILQMIRERYKPNSWQEYVVLENQHIPEIWSKLYDYQYYLNIEEYIEKFSEDLKFYGINQSEIKFEIDKNQIEEEYNSIMNLLDTNDWKSGANYLIDIYNCKINELDIEEYESLLSSYQDEINEIKYRIEKDIPFGYDYLNLAMQNKRSSEAEIKKLEKKEKLTYKEKIEYQEYKRELAESKYIIDNKLDITNEFTVRNRIANVFLDENQQIYIIILIVFVASTIVSNEFSKNTMKQLLIKPYKRTRILMSKLITCFIILILSTIYVVLSTTIANVILFGNDTLKVPMVLYDYNNGILIEMNMITYLIIQFITKLPIFIGIIFIAFSFGTIFASSIISALLSMFVYIAQWQFIEITENTLPLTQILLTTNWDLSNYLLGKLHIFEQLTLEYSLINCFIYFVLLIVPAFLWFKHGDIKNK